MSANQRTLEDKGRNGISLIMKTLAQWVMGMYTGPRFDIPTQENSTELLIGHLNTLKSTRS